MSDSKDSDTAYQTHLDSNPNPNSSSRSLFFGSHHEIFTSSASMFVDASETLPGGLDAGGAAVSRDSAASERSGSEMMPSEDEDDGFRMHVPVPPRFGDGPGQVPDVGSAPPAPQISVMKASIEELDKPELETIEPAVSVTENLDKAHSSTDGMPLPIVTVPSTQEFPPTAASDGASSSPGSQSESMLSSSSKNPFTNRVWTVRLPDGRTVDLDGLPPRATVEDLWKALEDNEIVAELDLDGAEVRWGRSGQSLARTDVLEQVCVTADGGPPKSPRVQRSPNGAVGSPGRVDMLEVYVSAKRILESEEYLALATNVMTGNGSEDEEKKLTPTTAAARGVDVDSIIKSARIAEMVLQADPPVRRPSTVPTDHFSINVHLPYGRIIPMVIPKASTVSTLKALLYPELAVLPQDLSQFQLYHGERRLGETEVVSEIKGIQEFGVRLVLAPDEQENAGPAGSGFTVVHVGEQETVSDEAMGWERTKYKSNMPHTHSFPAEFNCATCGKVRIECISCSRPFCPTCTRNSPAGKAYYSSTPKRSRSKRFSGMASSPTQTVFEAGKTAEDGQVRIEETGGSNRSPALRPVVQCLGCLELKEERETTAMVQRRRMHACVAILLLIIIALIVIVIAMGAGAPITNRVNSSASRR
ncbi:hypothetical protein HDU96_010685 [Phlyctochytrium bullatum]|nr:hypothetical protein HDU96_010685 [Phlyctochytrium bullatum]